MHFVHNLGWSIHLFRANNDLQLQLLKKQPNQVLAHSGCRTFDTLARWGEYTWGRADKCTGQDKPDIGKPQ